MHMRNLCKHTHHPARTQTTDAMAAHFYRIGVDVGGTNTDAVMLDALAPRESADRGVLALHKTPTTSPDVTDGIETAVRRVLTDSGVPASAVACLTIGTTHFINAIVEQDARRLSKVAVVRLSRSFTRQVPPFSDFPPALRRILDGGCCVHVDGGLHIDGAQEAPVREEQVVQACTTIRERGLNAIVVAGVFSPIDDRFRQEQRVRDIIRCELPGADVVCSADVSQLGFLEREDASILNASILRFARRTIRGFRAAMGRLDLHCPLYLTQNDGTLIDAATAARLPIRTFSSGPTNSMRGAAYLGLSDHEATATLVVDIGGTTADVGVLLPSGFPRQASAYVTVAGVNINFAMPHIESIGLGGGSVVRVAGDGSSDPVKVTVGPDSVGYQLTTKGTVFGGDVLTATDIAVAAAQMAGKKADGENEIGNSDLVRHLSPAVVAAAQARIQAMLEAVIDKMKTSPAPLPVLLVGGGSVVAPAAAILKGVSRVVCPPFHAVANAVGAAIAKVAGTVDAIQSTADRTTDQLLDQAKATAIERAVALGARPESIYIADVDVIPLQYVANQVRVIVRAVGELSLEGIEGVARVEQVEDEENETEVGQEADKVVLDMVEDEITTETASDPLTYCPTVRKNPSSGIQEWLISETDLVWLADGCYVLGCAGGGTPFSDALRIRDQLRAGHCIRVIDASSLRDDAVVYWGGHMGSPAVSNERLANDETEQAVAELMAYLGHSKIDAFIDLEIGGANGLQALTLGSTKYQDCPAVDADFMGRAYPTYWQTTLSAYEDDALVPCAISSGDGITIIMTRTNGDEIVDRALRASCAQMGSRVGMAARPTTKAVIERCAVANTLSLAWRVGRAIARAAATNTTSTVAEQMIEECGGPDAAKVLFRGKIVAVDRRLHLGHSYGEIRIEQMQQSELETTAETQHAAVATGGSVTIPFKNENLYALHTAEDGRQTYLATVPDLISVIDSQSGRALGVPEFRYGVIVTVIGIVCSPRWTETAKGLEIGGPAAFGYDIPYTALGTYVKPRSVIEEYGAM
ncbi:hydantoinase/oxoprolinase [Grosmannia clavigera kw1407]|uniref:Hydantoinase/oxoprolinase n=1 Tax=Grosmannia clavigera (strain kw1407 / UAMH 11150) TaxID=655863 RepID=F0X6N9_GROCL|nr:hydantoinase/oxoprolinase [Grosmannia clavigera kw1407]EFX06405.1 hydantoinase/oxoprolinase [Grosmannia clavigera kw1407]